MHRRDNTSFHEDKNWCVSWFCPRWWESHNIHYIPQNMRMHHNDVTLSIMASRITDNSTVCLGLHKRKHQSMCYRPFVRGIHRWPMDSPHKGPVTRKAFLWYDVIMGLVLFGCVITSYRAIKRIWCAGYLRCAAHVLQSDSNLWHKFNMGNQCV